MLWHPLLIGITILDMCILTLLLKAGRVALRVILAWQPDSSSFAQLQLERRFETADVITQWAFILMIVNLATIMVAVTQGLPKIVPGAMCGMGVMQAIGDPGCQLILIRSIALALLYWQRVLARLNHHNPMSPLTSLLARLLLLAMVFHAMAAYDSLTAFFGYLDPAQPVSCCTLLYDRIQPRMTPAIQTIWQAPAWPAGFGLVSAGLLIFIVRSLVRRKCMEQMRSHVMILVLGIIWTVAAIVNLIFFFTPYIYQVLDHHCPFCLFLPEHYGIGFLLFGQIFALALECPVPLFLYRVHAVHSDLRQAAQKRCRRANLILMAGLLGFCLAAMLPALLWRLRFGVWI